MHYIAEIVIPPTPKEGIKDAITEVMDYFREEDDEGQKEHHASWWDFWVIGGRFSGHKLEASIGQEKLTAFNAELAKRKVTVSGLTCGKEQLQPASQIPMVDTLWREMVPGFGDQCPLFNHSRDQYGREGVYDDDICTVAEIPADLSCSRLIVAIPQDWAKHDPDRLHPCRMLVKEFWNGVEHQDTNFGGKVKDALQQFAREKAEDNTRMNRIDIQPDWLVVTVDYHD